MIAAMSSNLSRTPWVLAGVMLCFMTACAAEDPAEPIPLPDAGAEEPGDVMLSAAADSLTTPWNTVKVTGVGPAQGSLIITSQARGEETLTLGSTGDFCRDVHLADGENVIRLEAMDAGGTVSEPVFLSVVRAGEPPVSSGGEPGEIRDRTAGATYYGNADGSGVGEIELNEGAWAALVNDESDDLTKFTGYYAGNDAVAFKLSERMRVHGFNVSVPAQDGETCGPDAFELYISDREEPELAFDGVNWIKLAELDADDGVEEAHTYELDADFPADATHFAIMGTNPTCGIWLYSNVYGFSEIRVLAEDAAPGAPVEDGAPNCASAE